MPRKRHDADSKKPRKSENRKNSLNHLLNFHLPDREKATVINRKSASKSQKPHTRNQFLQANFRFVVDASVSDVSDPDVVVDWDRVIQVKMWCKYGEEIVCPICLHDAVLPKITPCGHVFCWHCILRYLSFAEKYWKRCPMCFDSVSRTNLRNVLIEQSVYSLSVGADLCFKLLERPKGSVLSMPVEERDKVRASSDSDVKKKAGALWNSNVTPQFDDVHSQFAHIVVATAEYIKQIITNDISLLCQLLRNDPTCEESPFYNEALALSKEKLSAFETSLSNSVGQRKSNRNTKMASDSTKDSTGFYEYYQLENGQNVILHPFNLKCLIREFSGRSLPRSISGKIVNMEIYHMNDQMRKKYRFLGHLPLFSDFYLCEVEFVDCCLSPATQLYFESEIKQRKKNIEKKLQLDLAFREKMADQKIYHQPSIENTYNLQSIKALESEFPSIGIDHVNGEVKLLEDEGIESSDYTQSVSSFATVTENFGFYPALDESTSSSYTSRNTGFDNNAWATGGGGGKNELEIRRNGTSGGGKTKKKKNKGVPLFSTAHRRSYQ